MLALPFVLLLSACHNTNPEQGSGGKKVDNQTTLSSDAIVDSTKALLNQSFELENKLANGQISSRDFRDKNSALVATYNVLYKSLSPADTMKVNQYRLQKEAERNAEAAKTTKASKWE